MDKNNRVTPHGSELVDLRVRRQRSAGIVAIAAKDVNGARGHAHGIRRLRICRLMSAVKVADAEMEEIVFALKNRRRPGGTAHPLAGRIAERLIRIDPVIEGPDCPADVVGSHRR